MADNDPTESASFTFEHDIRPLFRESDRTAMRRGFDLWNYDDVRTHQDAIIARLADGSMPCDGPWSAAQVNRFQEWIDDGSPR